MYKRCRSIFLQYFWPPTNEDEETLQWLAVGLRACEDSNNPETRHAADLDLRRSIFIYYKVPVLMHISILRFHTLCQVPVLMHNQYNAFCAGP